MAKIRLVSALGYLAASLGLIVVLLVQAALRATSEGSESTDEELELYFQLRSHLHQSGLMLGVIVALATLTTGTLRDLQLSIKGTATYPTEYILIWGAYSMIVIALVYVPVYSSLLAFGRKIRDTRLPLPRLDSGSWSQIYSTRNELADYMQLSVMSGQSFQVSIAITAPLIAGIVSTLLR